MFPPIQIVLLIMQKGLIRGLRKNYVVNTQPITKRLLLLPIFLIITLMHSILKIMINDDISQIARIKKNWELHLRSNESRIIYIVGIGS